MRLNQLEYLLAVAREGSYQNAAKRLGVSQSTISVAIKNLEEELAFQLVQRSGKGVALTKKGHLVVEKAASIELDMREMQKLTLDNDTFENTGKSRFFERRTSRVLY